MTRSAKPQSSSKHGKNHGNAKTLLSTLKFTTTLGAISLSLAGWALLSRVEAVNVAQAAQMPPAGSASAASVPSSSLFDSAAQIAPSRNPPAVAVASVTKLRVPSSSPALTSPTSTSPAPTPTAAATSAPTETPPPTPTDTALPPVAAAVAALPAPTATPMPTATPIPTATPAPTPTATVKFKLDVVQWVQTNTGDRVAIVRDNRGVLWYVWGTDVPRIEQGLSPQYQPAPVNGVTRSRRS